MKASLAVLAVAIMTGRLEAQPPNIVVFISDDHGYLDSSVAGATDVLTPNLAKLAARGVTCTQAFAASPTCAPSRAAMLTGLAPLRNGSMLNHQPPRADVKKLPAYLRELGYEVVAFGKVAHYEQVKQYGFDRAEHFAFHDDACVGAAVDFLRARQPGKPLCLMVGTNWPHVPWPEAGTRIDVGGMRLPSTHVDTPETRAWRARYYAAIEKMDADFGLVYDAAYAALGDNTFFLHFSDHGAQWPFAKWNLYDAGTRVPFFATWPGKIRPGSKTDAMISLLDVLPTLVEAGGGKEPENLDGRSSLPELRGEPRGGREDLFATHSGDGRMNDYPMRCVRTSRYKYIVNLRPDADHHTHIDLGKAVDGHDYWSSWVAKVESDAAAREIVGRYLHRPAEEFYDLAADPDEQHNLAADPHSATALDAARLKLKQWMAQGGDEGLATERAVKTAFSK